MLVVPADTGVNTPVLLIVAMPVLDEFQVYNKIGVPVAFDVSDKEPPIQTAFPPVIGFATGKLTTTAKTGDVA